MFEMSLLGHPLPARADAEPGGWRTPSVPSAAERAPYGTCPAPDPSPSGRQRHSPLQRSPGLIRVLLRVALGRILLRVVVAEGSGGDRLLLGERDWNSPPDISRAGSPLLAPAPSLPCRRCPPRPCCDRPRCRPPRAAPAGAIPGAGPRLASSPCRPPLQPPAAPGARRTDGSRPDGSRRRSVVSHR